jgi:group I intron endonuclease
MKSNEVYKITNKITNKVYIGITNQGSGARYRHHWYESRTGEPSPIHRSMAKYGEENFTLEIIDFADTYDELKEREKYWIKQYNSTDKNIGYNLTEGGDGTFGRKHSEETKEKIRQKALGRKASEETKRKMSESRKGIVSEKKKDHIQSMIEMGKKKVIAKFTRTDESGLLLEITKEFNSMIECAKFFKISKDTVTKYCKSENHYCKKCGAYIFYKES